ncbi:MAG: hypothetical protein ACYSX0_22170 [Planctomycetota bacterium]
MKPGGRLAATDVVATAELPEEIRGDLEVRSGCIAGAATIPVLEGLLADAGFAEIRLRPVDGSGEFIRESVPGRRVEDYIVSATIEAARP